MYTSHGHQIPGTLIEGRKPKVARCGGPTICAQCAKESLSGYLAGDTLPKTQTN